MQESREAIAFNRGLLSDLTLARATADRSELRRGDLRWLTEAWRSTATRVIPVVQGRFPVTAATGSGSAVRSGLLADWRSPIDLGSEWADAMQPDCPMQVMLLGVVGQTAHFAARVTDQADGGASDSQWSDLRAAGTRMTATDSGLLVSAVALDNWHAQHPHCARCGAPTAIRQAGWQRQCLACAAESYPRTDPAVIMLVVDGDDRALLGRRVDWQPEWFSTLAGFVEAGESAEAAVRREVAEESGVTVGEVHYLGSQPWPFPWSLMLGYHARATSTDICVDGEEIVEARWFTRDELMEACADGSVAVPPAVSIARKLIEHWFGSSIPGEWEMRR